MSDYIKKLEQENEELSIKIENLKRFINSNYIFSKLPYIEQELMRAQLHNMITYHSILELRISYAYEKENLVREKMYNTFIRSSYD